MFDSVKTVLLENKYFYVKATKGFELEGVQKEVIPSNLGFYRFFVDNLSKALGNSYINVRYDSTDSEFVCYTSDLFLDNVQPPTTTGIETIVESVEGLPSALEVLYKAEMLSGYPFANVSCNPKVSRDGLLMSRAFVFEAVLSYDDSFPALPNWLSRGTDFNPYSDKMYKELKKVFTLNVGNQNTLADVNILNHTTRKIASFKIGMSTDIKGADGSITHYVKTYSFSNIAVGGTQFNTLSFDSAFVDKVCDIWVDSIMFSD